MVVWLHWRYWCLRSDHCGHHGRPPSTGTTGATGPISSRPGRAVSDQTRWPLLAPLLLVLLVPLVLLVGCTTTTSPPPASATALPSPTTPPGGGATVTVGQPVGSGATPTPLAAAGGATTPIAPSPTTPATRPAGTFVGPTPSPATPGSRQPGTLAPASSPVATTPRIGITAEALQIEGRRIGQLVIAGDGRRYAVTEGGLYALNGTQFERRAEGGRWPSLVAVDGATLVTGEHPPCARGGDGTPLRRSLDGGRTWQVAQRSDGRGTLAGRPFQLPGGNLLAIACDGLFSSRDAGATWQRQTFLPPDNEPVAAALSPDGRQLYLVVLVGEGGTTRLLAASQQNGGWGAVRTLREGWGSGTVTVVVEAGLPLLLFGTPLGLEISRDGGATWQRQNTGLESTILLADPRRDPLPPAEEAKLRRGAGIYSLAARGNRPPLLLGGSDGLYRWVDNRWSKLTPLANQLVREIFFDPDGIVYVRTDAGITRLRGL